MRTDKKHLLPAAALRIKVLKVLNFSSQGTERKIKDDNLHVSDDWRSERGGGGGVKKNREVIKCVCSIYLMHFSM